MTTPPTPWLEASTIPTKSGQPDTSSLHRVGSFVDSRRSVRQPLIAASNCLWLDNHTIWGFCARIRLQGDSSPTPAGIAVNACRSFATIVSNCLKGMPPVPRNASRIQHCRVARSFSCFASSSQIIFVLPSKSKPNRVLSSEYRPSSLRSFFFEIGSLSCNCPAETHHGCPPGLHLRHAGAVPATWG